jgi:glycosyltransferase involved in cell wall biosynthesis
MRVLVLSSLASSLLNFRGQLLAAMVGEGHEVVACAPERDPVVEARLRGMGVRFVQTKLARAGSNPLLDLETLAEYMELILRERPGVVLAYTQKPIIYGGLAARLAGGCRFYALISGLGYVFSSAADHRRFLRAIVRKLYRFALKRAQAILVFNSDDRPELLRQGIITKKQIVVQVPGSGVDLNHFRASPVPEGPPTFLMIARLMHDKGLKEYVEAARIVRARHPQAQFHLLGKFEDANPTGISRAELDRWLQEGVVTYLGHTDDVRPYLAASSVFVLPSYYREGLPRTILEAMASGRPVVTTDMPGCRDPIEPGQNGLLVQPQDAGDLASALLRFAEEPELAQAMGKEARRIAETRYDVRLVNAQLLSEMRLGRADSYIEEVLPLASDRPVAAEGI